MALPAILRQATKADLSHALNAELATRDLAHFVRLAWHVHHPDLQLIWNWHLDAIIDHLSAVSSGQINRLVINVIPGSMKSLLTSVYWPAWEWLSKPTLSYLCCSATNDVVMRDALRMHEVVASPWYQGMFRPSWGFDKSQNAKGFFINTAGGVRWSRSTNQKITGLRPRRIVIDDPLDASDAYNDKAALPTHTRWYDTVLSPRLAHPKDPIVLIMQRLHERDLSAHVLEQEGWVLLCLPNEYDGPRSKTIIDWVDPRTQEGELLFPARIDAHETKLAKERLGPVGYAGQYQQKPAPAEGAIFREPWFRYWRKNDVPNKFDMVIGTWDCTWKGTSDSDYVCGQAWGIRGAEIWLLSQYRARLDFAGTVVQIRQQRLLHPEISVVLVENKANGQAIINALRSEIPGIIGYNPQGSSKVERAQATLPRYQAGQIWFPDPQFHGWVRDIFLPEVLAFPAARHDDQVDAMTQMLNWWIENGSVTPWIFKVK